MWIWLDKTGQVEQYLTHGSSAVVGETNFQIFAYFHELNLNDIQTATIKFEKPDKTNSTYPALFMTRATMDYTYMDSDGSLSRFNENDSPYSGFLFDFANFEGGDEVVKLLDTPGLWKATITLLGTYNKITVSGLITFSVGPSAYDTEDPTEVTVDQVLQNFIISNNFMFEEETSYLRVTDDFVVSASEGTLDKNIFTIGSIVLDMSTRGIYQIQTTTVNDNDKTKVYATYERIYLSGAYDVTATDVVINLR